GRFVYVLFCFLVCICLFFSVICFYKEKNSEWKEKFTKTKKKKKKKKASKMEKKKQHAQYIPGHLEVLDWVVKTIEKANTATNTINTVSHFFEFEDFAEASMIQSLFVFFRGKNKTHVNTIVRKSKKQKQSKIKQNMNWIFM
ncbi:hypothetical protein RFI_19194, partial [Reticulomyxa filosa]